MKCCLINPLPKSSSITYSPPLGLAYIAAILEENGHDVKILDRMAIKYHNGEISLKEIDELTKKEIYEFQPSLIGIGAMTIQIYDAYHVVKLIRRFLKGNYIIGIGGVHPTAETELTLRECPEIDFVCRGEGEFTMLEIVSGKSLIEIDGLAIRKNREIQNNKNRKVFSNLDTIPMPARHLLNMKFYTKRNDKIIPGLHLRATTMVTSRGCPYNCKFCSSKLMFPAVRFHSWNRVLEEIETVMKDYGIEAVDFVDSMFLSDRKRAERICSELINSGLNRRLKWACSIRVDAVDKKILDLMKEAGCIYVNYGFESGSQEMLDSMNKRTTVRTNYTAARMTNEAGILVNSAMIVGLPGETEEDILATMRFLRNTKIYCSSINLLLPLPGSPYYKEFRSSGILNYSEKLWKEIGVLPASIKDIKFYSKMPRKKFLQLYQRLNSLVNYRNTINYLRRYWYKNPFITLKSLIVLFIKRFPFIYTFLKLSMNNIKRLFK